ncbi:MAG: MaoC/PaaZ C-terminal domain-containing protein [Acidimicrobiia bacterium]
MALPVDKLGTQYPPLVAQIEPERAKAYAAATNDPNPAYADGSLAPPVFAVVPTWPPMVAAVSDLVPPEALMFVVHGEQDMHFHQPLVPDATLRTHSVGWSTRVGPSGTRFVVKLVSVDGDDRPALDQFVTIFIRGMSDGESAGPDKPGHEFPEEARAQPAGSFTVHVDDDQTFRYRDASGDPMPIHVDEDFARSVGLPGIIAHGLCTMAMCGQAVIETVAGGDPARLKRLAVRFAANVLPGNDIVVELFDAGEHDGRHGYAFEASSAGALVVKHGWAEVLA